MAATALAGGVLAGLFGSASPASATCSEPDGLVSGNVFCFDSETTNRSYTVDGGALFHLGSEDSVAISPYELTASTTDPAFGIDATGSTVTVHVFSGSTLEHAVNEDGVGLEIDLLGSEVHLNVDGPVDSFDQAQIIGTAGIVINGSGLAFIANDGHVRGNTGAALKVDGADADVTNGSLFSMVGATNGAEFGLIAAVPSVAYDNTGGLTAGLGGDGLRMNDVNGAGKIPDDLAVDIKNRGGGVIAGDENGINITNVGGDPGSVATDIGIDNHGDDVIGGGFIGGESDGIVIEGISRNVLVDNRNTLNDSIALDAIPDPDFQNKFGPAGENIIAALMASNANKGIVGDDNGIAISESDGRVEIRNEKGLIAGASHDGIRLFRIEGIPDATAGSGRRAVDIYNSGGRIWGGEAGIDIPTALSATSARGDIFLGNPAGIVFGIAQAVNISNLIFSNVEIHNANGLIEGYYDDAIDITGAPFPGAGADVTIVNGDLDADTGGYVHGGRIFSPDIAINVGPDPASARGTPVNIDVRNGSGGAIIGDGRDPVMRLVSLNQTSIRNDGLMASENVPTYEHDPGNTFGLPDFNRVPLALIDVAQIGSDAAGFFDFGMTAGGVGSIEKLSAYARPAADLLLSSESASFLGSFVGGAMDFLNTGVMIGRVQSLGLDHNSIVNFGSWLTTDLIGETTAGFAGNSLSSGSGADTIHNLGLVQTAFRSAASKAGAAAETAHFSVGDFFNGAIPSRFSFSGGSGLLSLIDGAPGDATFISGNYHGASRPGFHAYLGVDVTFNGGKASSDLLQIGEVSGEPVKQAGGDIDGSTGIVIHRTGTPGGPERRSIAVVKVFGVDDNPASMQCFGKACKEGDTFFIAPQSSNYVIVNGIGAVEDGFNLWYITEQEPTPGDPVFQLSSTVKPWTGGDLAGLTAGAQNIWYDASGVVEDHIYGNHFPVVGAGGGGADLPPEVESAPGEAAGNRYGQWARISGNWTNRGSSVTDPVFGTFDTSADQNTYAVLGGADFSPNGQEGGFRFGILGGYATSSLDFAIAPESADYQGGLVGGYIAYTNGGFYVDSQVNWNPLDATFHTSFADIDTRTDSLGIISNTGYRIDRGSFFVEPIGSLAYLDTSVDDVTTAGATVDFSNGESLQGGVGGRVGTNFAIGEGTAVEVSLLGKLWNEFEDANHVTITQGGKSAGFTDSISGMFGEVTASATIYTADRRASGFIAGGAKFGGDLTSWHVKAGLRLAL